MSNPEMILAFDAYRDLKKIVDDKGADYVYEGAYHDNCMYWDYDEDAPSCIVGHYFYYQGWIKDSNDAYRIENNIATIPINTFEHTENVEFSQATKAMLLAVQQRQDAGWTWGNALAFGLEVAHYAIDELGETVEDIDTVIKDVLVLWRERGNEPLFDPWEELA
jgi:hypothetical protein